MLIDIHGLTYTLTAHTFDIAQWQATATQSISKTWVRTYAQGLATCGAAYTPHSLCMHQEI